MDCKEVYEYIIDHPKKFSRRENILFVEFYKRRFLDLQTIEKSVVTDNFDKPIIRYILVNILCDKHDHND